LALTASGPSSFTGEFYLFPFFETEADGHSHAEATVQTVGIGATYLTTL